MWTHGAHCGCDRCRTPNLEPTRELLAGFYEEELPVARAEAMAAVREGKLHPGLVEDRARKIARWEAALRLLRSRRTPATPEESAAA